jgi:hypothetical protein
MIFIIAIVVGIVCAFIGAEMAKNRGRDAAVWAVICFLFPIVGILALAIAGGDGRHPVQSVTNSQSKYGNQLDATAVSNALPAASPLSSASQAWKTLKEFDIEIRQAAEALSPFGVDAEERLAKAYLAVSDKALLPSMVAKIADDEEKVKADKTDQRAKALAKNSSDALEKLTLREQAAAQTIQSVKANGMVFNGRRVTSAEMYDGDDAHDFGFARLAYADGGVELRAGATFILVRHPN